MKYTKEEFEAIVISGVIWEELAERGCFKDKLKYYPYRFIEKIPGECPLCANFNCNDFDTTMSDASVCPLYKVTNCICATGFSLYYFWYNSDSKKARQYYAKKILENIYKASDDCD